MLFDNCPADPKAQKPPHWPPHRLKGFVPNWLSEVSPRHLATSTLKQKWYSMLISMDFHAFSYPSWEPKRQSSVYHRSRVKLAKTTSSLATPLRATQETNNLTNIPFIPVALTGGQTTTCHCFGDLQLPHSGQMEISLRDTGIVLP